MAASMFERYGGFAAVSKVVMAFNEAVSLLQQTLAEFGVKLEDVSVVINDIRNRAQYIIGA